MSPALTAIPPTPDGEARPKCIGCMGDLSDSALKCGHCQAHVHLRCSGLPDYLLIRLAVTQSSYSCLICVKLKDMKGDEASYSAELTKINETIAKEISIIDQENNNDSEESGNNGDEAGSTQRSSQTNQDNSNGLQPVITTQRAVCKFYLQKSCKYGRKGDGCSYSHPKLCYSFIKRGDRRGGCKKGNQCAFVHPKLCRRALETRICTNQKCRMYHVTGTKFSKEEEPEMEREEHVPRRILQRSTPFRDALVRPARSQQNPTIAQRNSRSDSEGIEDNLAGSGDFLEMKQQMKLMQEQIQLLISITKSQSGHFHPPPQVGWSAR